MIWGMEHTMTLVGSGIWGNQRVRVEVRQITSRYGGMEVVVVEEGQLILDQAGTSSCPDFLPKHWQKF